MRKILFLAFIVIGFNLPLFSQSDRPIQIDTTAVKFAFDNSMKTFKHGESIDLNRRLVNPGISNNFQSFKLMKKGVAIGQLSNLRIKVSCSFDNMPCLKPQGRFPMPIYKSDSTVNYTLLIKKHNVAP